MKKIYDLRSSLAPFMPEHALDEVVILLQKFPIHLGLMAPRSRVYGDYLSPAKVGGYHKITVNGDLNKYAFLLTFLHEYAHLLVFVGCGPRAQAHGSEWKTQFRLLLQRFVEQRMFPEDICVALRNYMVRMPASTSADPQLMRVLERYNERKRPENETTVEKLSFGERFSYNGEVFRRGERLRKNYLCVRVSDEMRFRFNPVAKVLRIAISD